MKTAPPRSIRTTPVPDLPEDAYRLVQRELRAIAAVDGCRAALDVAEKTLARVRGEIEAYEGMEGR